MKDILIITNYFPPETGAASNRMFHLSQGLHEHQFNVSVLTPLPNYPKGEIFEGFKGVFKKSTIDNGITIQRLWIFASNSKNKFNRLVAMLSYSFSLIWYFAFNKIPQTVIVQSPPLIVAFTCMFFLRSRKRKIILNISDLWPLAGLELGVFRKNYSYRLLEKIEYFNYRNATCIVGQSNEILDHVKHIYPNKRTFLYRNYPNIPAIDKTDNRVKGEKIKLVYAGLLGVAQGIHKLCKNLNFSKIEFHIYGAGPEQNLIQSFISENPELPIVYYGELSRARLHQVLMQYDAAIIPLLNRIYGSVPSKIFEFSKLGLPLIYFGGGEGESILGSFKLGWSARSGDYDHLNSVIAKIEYKDLSQENRQRIKQSADQNFNFDAQLDALVKNILD